MAPQGGNTLTTRAIRTPPHTLSQQPQSGASSPSPVQILTSTREPHVAATPSSVSCPQVTHSAISPQVQTGPTRTATSDLMSATLAEAATQLSFAEYLERCILLRASPPLPLPVPTNFWMQLCILFHTSLSHRTSPPNSRSRSSLSDASTRKIPRGPWFHLRHTTLSVRRVPDPSLRYFLTRLCRRLCTASHLTMPTPNHRSRSSSSGASTPRTLWIAKAHHRHIAMQAAPHFHNPLTLLRCAAPAAPGMLAMVTGTLRLHACHHSGLQVSRSMPTCAPHMVYLVKQPWCDLACVHPPPLRPCSYMSVPPKWEHIWCAQLLPTKGVQVPPWREPTMPSVPTLVREVVLFLILGPWFFLWSTLGKPNLTGSVTLIQPTASSCITNTVSVFFSGIQDRHAGTPPISLRRLAEGSMRLFFKKPVIMSTTSPISSLRTLATRTLPSCSTRTPSSPTLWF